MPTDSPGTLLLKIPIYLQELRLSRAVVLKRLCTEFASVGSAAAKIIISEINLENKTIQPLNIVNKINKKLCNNKKHKGRVCRWPKVFL